MTLWERFREGLGKRQRLRRARPNKKKRKATGSERKSRSLTAFGRRNSDPSAPVGIDTRRWGARVSGWRGFRG